MNPLRYAFPHRDTRHALYTAALNISGRLLWPLLIVLLGVGTHLTGGK